ncbi:TPA: alpha/beta fold hydrolase [Legionella bozemanae]
MADDVVALCSVLNIQQAHFVGNSMGGFILQSLAYRSPKLVQSETGSLKSVCQCSCSQRIKI